MPRAALAFSVTTLLPVPLLVMGAIYGGWWGWSALLFLTVFVFVIDELGALALPTAREGQEFPAADRLSITLALAHFGLLVLILVNLRLGIGFGDAIALFLATGLYMGQVSNSNAHELIHRSRGRIRELGKWVYISMLFGHHVSAHRYVHHVHVASDADPNSAALGQSYYRFARQAWLGSFQAGLNAENARQADREPWQHPYLVYVGGALACCGVALGIAGLTGLLFYIGLAAFTQSQLLMSDYVQHYGLRRDIGQDGQTEPVGPGHSWNAPHPLSGYLMLNAPRHSDHHANPARHFPALRLPAPEHAPALPHSLPAMSVIALYPALWRRVMDPRVAKWQSGPDRLDMPSAA